LKKYFKTVGNCNWVFSAVLKGKDHTRMIRLYRASSITIKRYIKIRGEAHPFNSAFKEYFEKREGNKTRS
jgi:RNA-directed DNA polymerase